MLLDGNALVKTVNFSSPKYVGDPINTLRIFNEKEVDELIILDITATKSNSEPNYELIEQLSSECFMPLCYGGAIRNIQQAHRLFQLGIEKISLQTSAFLDPGFVQELANMFGSQAVTVSIDVVRDASGKIILHKENSILNFEMNWLETLELFVSSGAGEILLTSVDREGTRQGMDLDLIRQASIDLPVPLIAHGGVGTMDDIRDALAAGADAVAGGSYFVFHGRHKAVLITYPSRAQLDELDS
jgi:cyclase